MINAIAWAVLGVLALACAPARADGTATASLADLHLELVDLAPGDGIAPAVTFSGPDGGSYAAAEASVDVHSVSGAQAFDPLSVSVGPLDGYGASASIAGDFFAGSLAMQANAFSSNVHVGGADASALLYDDHVVGLPNLPFTLSPHTRLVISGAGACAAVDTLALTDIASAEIFMGLTDSLEDAVAGINTDDDVLSVRAGDGAAEAASDVSQRQVSVSFDNVGDSPRTGLFTVAIYASAVTVNDVGSVPEPGAGVLMLVASGLLGAMRRASSRRG